jgi:hypothetical protein
MQSAMAEDEESNDGKPAKPLPTSEDISLTLTLPVINDKGLTQQVSLLVTIIVPYGQGDQVKAAKPKLDDAYISDLYGTLGSGSALMKGGLIDVKALKDHLQADTDKVLGPTVKAEVLVPAMQQSQR